jgi:hypothetical protein
MIVFHLQDAVTYASASPSFSLQEIKDDIKNQNNDRISRIVPSTGNPNYPDIQLVDYLSDSRFLNATIWFNSPAFNDTLSCGMFIDADSNSQTGYGGMEYEMMAAGDIQNGQELRSWKQFIIEHSSIFDFFRTLKEQNYTGQIDSSTYSSINEPNSKYCTLSLDLSIINHPGKYRVLFYTSLDHEKTLDFTNWVDIPPPQFTISTNPPLVLRPGDDREFPVQVASTSTPIDSIINLTLVNNGNNTNNKKSNTISPDNPNIIIKKIQPPALEITIPRTPNATGIYQIPLKLTVSTESLAPTRVVGIEMSSLYPARGYITGATNLTMTVLAPLSPTEQFKAVWDVYGQPISIILGGFAGGAASFFFDKLKKGKKND